MRRRFELNDRADEWARDFVPAVVRGHDGKVKLFRSDYRAGGKVGSMLASELNLDFIDEAPSRLPGGNLLVDSRGNCFSTDGRFDVSILKYCKKVVILPKLDGEGTTHVDIFAKFINENTAFVSSYASDQVEIIENPFYNDAVCSDADIAAGKLYSCPYVMTADGKPYQIAVDNAKAKTLSFSEISSFLDQTYPGLEIARKPLGPVSWPQHTETVAEILRFHNFEVVKIEAPKPLLRVTINRYKDTRGKLIKETLEADLVFRTYANSLVTNGTALVPTYPATNGQELDQRALGIYSKYLGARIFAVPSDYSILGGGAVHCLTREFSD